jgi:phytoene dehydrogenase-like protein
MKPVLQLFDQIMALKGFRQVTVATSYLGARTYDVSEDGDIGYDKAHRDSLLEHLQEAVENFGGVVVRQFQAEKVLVRMPVGPRLLPIKHVLGVRAGRGRWTGLSSDEVRTARMTDSVTGKALKLEKGVRFLDWSAGVAATPLTANRPAGD